MGLFDGLIKAATDTVTDVLDDVFDDDTVDTIIDITKTAATAYALKKAYDYMSTPQQNIPQQPQMVTNSANQSTGDSSPSTGTSINTTPTGSQSVQVSASTDANIPILYGRSTMRGIVFDAALKNSNTTLVTALMLCERTGTGTLGNASYEVNKVFFNDANLVFNANGTVANATLSDGTTTTKFNENTTVRIYSGSELLQVSKIPGANGLITPSFSSATTYMPHWESALNYKLNGSVFAIIEQDYDPENDVQGVGTWTFDITNTNANDPGSVVYDYLTNKRYGAGYDTSLIDSDSFIGSGDNSLKSRGERTEIFLSLDPNDEDANADLANSELFPMLVTQGDINDYRSFTVATYDSGNTAISGNVMAPGNSSNQANAALISTEASRLKIFWANTTISGNINNSLTGNNTFTAFLDIARLVPAGEKVSALDANLAQGNVYPGDTYNYTPSILSANTVVVPNIAPNTAITNFLVKGDKIRPEGSPFIYTVAANVDVPSPGYETFEIPVMEKIAQINYAETDFGNATIGTEAHFIPNLNASYNVTKYKNDYESLGFYYYNGWPFNGATANGAVSYPNEYYTDANVLFSNCLVGNAAMLTPGTEDHDADPMYLGTQSRTTINALLSTQNSVSTNLDALMAHSEGTLSYDLRSGQWKAIPLGNANIDGAYEFTDDNIIGQVTLSTGDFDSFYNKVKATYIDQKNDGKQKEIILYTPDSEKAPNEPPKQMELNFPFASTASQAARLAGIELAQNRFDLVVSFTSDYSSIIVRPGDIVKVSVDSYGFSEKLFKIMQAKESLRDDILVCDFVAIEYSPGLYTSDSDGGGTVTGAGLTGGGGAGNNGGGTAGGGSGLGDPENDPDPITTTPPTTDTTTYPPSIDGGGITNNTVHGDSIVDNSITIGKLAFGVAVAPMYDEVYNTSIPPSNVWTEVGNVRFQWDSSRAGTTAIYCTHFSSGTAFGLDSNHLLSGTYGRLFRSTATLKHAGNSTVVDTGGMTVGWGQNANNKIDNNMINHTTIPIITTGTTYTIDPDANLVLDVLIEEAVDYGGTYAGAFESDVSILTQGPYVDGTDN